MAGICKHNHDADFCKECIAERGKLAANAAYGKMDAVSAYPSDLIPRITVRDHADIHVLIDLLSGAYQNAIQSPDVKRFRIRELLEAAQDIHTEMIIDHVATTILANSGESEEQVKETAERVAVLIVHPFFD